MIEHVFTLLMLILLQVVLGFDNLLYISIASRNAPLAKQAFVRKIGIAIAIILRIALLFILVSMIRLFQDPVFGINVSGIIQSNFNIHSLIVLLGGVFILYTAVKEIWHMIYLEESMDQPKAEKTVTQVIAMIVMMNLVFSFDSILGAIALTDVFVIMAIAIVISGIMMIWLADRVSTFLQRNRMYEVLGLFVLFLVGVLLLSEGGHLAHLRLFGYEITPMSKATFYFVIAVLVVVDVVQSRYQKNLLKQKQSKGLSESSKHVEINNV